MENTSNQLVNLIREIVKDELTNKDDATICFVQNVNDDGTLNIQLLSDMDTILTNIPNNSAYTFKYGDYAVLYKIDNNLSNAFIMSKVTNVPPELIQQTYIINEGGGGSGGTPVPVEGVADVQVDSSSIVNGQGIANLRTTGNYNPSTNKIATEGFVNSSVATNTAYFRGTYNIVTDLGLTTSATEQQIAAALATKMSAESITPTNNDYVFVAYPDAIDPTQFTKYDRYKYNGSNSTWEYEYTLNNSSFTAAQWDAINSGITSGDVSQITTNKNDIAGIKDGTTIDSFSDVESALGNKVDKTSTASQVYGTNSSGGQTTYNLSDVEYRPNLLSNPDFEIYYTTATQTSGYPCADWQLYGNGSGQTVSYNPSTKSLTTGTQNTAGYYGGLRQWIYKPYLYKGQTLTFSAELSAYTYAWLLQVWRYASLSSSPTVLSSVPYSTGYSKSLTFTMPDDLTEDDRIVLLIQTQGAYTLKNAKLQFGSYATEFVPPTRSEREFSATEYISSVIELGLTPPTTTLAVINAVYALVTTNYMSQGRAPSYAIRIANNNNNILTDAPDAYGLLTINYGSSIAYTDNPLRPQIIYSSARGSNPETQTEANADRIWIGQSVRTSGTTPPFTSIRWKELGAYCTCKTAGATVAKVATVPYYTLTAGNLISVYFDAANSVANPTLNINRTGAKPIYVDGAAATSSNLKAGWHTFYYDGTNYLTGKDVFVTVAGEQTITGQKTFSANKTYVNRLEITNTSDVSGNSNTTGAAPLLIGAKSGTHMEFDGNEIVAKTSSTDPGPLYLQSDGGSVLIGYNKSWANLDNSSVPLTVKGEIYNYGAYCARGIDANTNCEGYFRLATATLPEWYRSATARIYVQDLDDPHTGAILNISVYIGANGAVNCDVGIESSTFLERYLNKFYIVVRQDKSTRLSSKYIELWLRTASGVTYNRMNAYFLSDIANTRVSDPVSSRWVKYTRMSSVDQGYVASGVVDLTNGYIPTASWNTATFVTTECPDVDIYCDTQQTSFNGGSLYLSEGMNRINLTGQTIDLNTLTLSSGTLQHAIYECKTNGGSNNITNLPFGSGGGSFILDVDLERWVSTSDYKTVQKLSSSIVAPYAWMRWCTNGTWSAWAPMADYKIVGICETNADVAAKVVNIQGYTLRTGNLIPIYFVKTNTASSPTLNINGTGAKSIYYDNSTATAATALTAGWHMVSYNGSSYFTGTLLGGITSDSSLSSRQLRHEVAIKAGADINANRLIGAHSDNLYYQIGAGSQINTTFPILYANSAITSGVTGTNNWIIRYQTAANILNNGSSLTITSYAPVFLVGTLSGTIFTVDSSSWYTQTPPSSENGKHYLLLGWAYSTTNIALSITHPVYAYTGGAFREYTHTINANVVTVDGTQTITGTKTFTSNVTKKNTSYKYNDTPSSNSWGGLKYCDSQNANVGDLNFGIGTNFNAIEILINNKNGTNKNVRFVGYTVSGSADEWTFQPSTNGDINLGRSANRWNYLYVNRISGGSIDVSTTTAIKTINSVSNQNLLINSNFSINQRGQASYTANNAYTVDRWIKYGGGTVTVSTDHVTLSGSSGVAIEQYIEDTDFLWGKTVTLSHGASASGTTISGTVDLPSTAPTSNTNFISTSLVQLNYNVAQGKISVLFAGAQSIYWAKLELGEIATPYTPPLISEELLKCQRYYYKTGSASNAVFIAEGHAGSATVAFFPLTFPVPLRGDPDSTHFAYANINLYSVSGSNIAITSIRVAGFRFDDIFSRCVMEVNSTGLTSQASYILRATTNGYLEFDAEIY